MKLEIKNRTELTGVPSASGIEYFNHSFYVVGDNSAWLYVFDEAFNHASKHRIYDHISNVSDTIPKRDKPDFEATTLVLSDNQNRLFIFGSGSKSPQRDVLIQVDLSNPTNFKTFSLEHFYAALRLKGVGAINIEGAVFAEGKIFLFNRADNQMIQFSCSAFEAFLKDTTSPLDFNFYKFSLPQTNSVQAGFSGACLIPGTQKIVFTASVENTDNWIDDGSILGSYVGLIDLTQLSAINESHVLPVMEKSDSLSVKIESVAVKAGNKNKVELFLVTDSDGGTSELIEAELRF